MNATTELRPDLLRRVLAVMAFDNCDGLFWRVDNDVLTMTVMCSDFFRWAVADCEAIETEADVVMLEKARADLVSAGGDPYPIWIGELYAARRRKQEPAPMMFGDGKYAMQPEVQPLFRLASLLTEGEK